LSRNKKSERRNKQINGRSSTFNERSWIMEVQVRVIQWPIWKGEWGILAECNAFCNDIKSKEHDLVKRWWNKEYPSDATE